MPNPIRINWYGRWESDPHEFPRWYLKPLEAISRGGGTSIINNLGESDEAGSPPDHARPLHQPLRGGIEMSHTKGPWMAAPKQPHQPYIAVKHLDNTAGAASWDICKVTVRSSWAKEQTANARLIAAAPQLLEALKLAVDECYEVGAISAPEEHECKWLKQARAAIRAAEGEE